MAIIRDASGLFAICGIERNSFRSIEPLPSLRIPAHVSYPGVFGSWEACGGEWGCRERAEGHERVEFEEPLLQPFEFGSIDWSYVFPCVVGRRDSSNSRHRRQRFRQFSRVVRNH